MPNDKLTQFLLLPELKLLSFHNIQKVRTLVFECETKSIEAICPHCGEVSSRVHDRRIVTIADAPQNGRSGFKTIQNYNSFITQRKLFISFTAAEALVTLGRS